MKRALVLAVFVSLATLAAAQDSLATLSQVFAFFCNNDFTSCPDGIEPSSPLLRLSDGNVYGVTWWAGKGSANAGGTVFKVTPQGLLTVLHTFQPGLSGNFPLGENPVIGLALGPDGFLYGVTEQGGTHNSGVMYKVSTTGTGFRVLHNFCSLTNCVDGPGALVLAKDGNFYGVEYHTIFRITPTGVWSLVHSMDPTKEGFGGGSLIQASDGNFYGTGRIGSDEGTVFRVTPSGQFTLLHNLGSCGLVVTSNLIQANDGNIYGVTSESGSGTGIFRLSLQGSFEFIHQMTSSEGFSPSTLLQASDGNLWGLSTFNNGSIFAVSLAGQSITSTPFNCAVEGCIPQNMAQGKDGKFYGTTISGGDAPGEQPEGTVFKANAGLPPPKF